MSMSSDTQTIIAAVSESACLKDIARHGIRAGWGKFIYYYDCRAFYTKYGQMLMDWIASDDETMELHAASIYGSAKARDIVDVHTEYLYAALDIFAGSFRDECVCDVCRDDPRSDADEEDNDD